MRWLRRPAFRFTLIAALLCAALGVFLHFGFRLNLLPAWILAVNIVTFLVYAYDKRVAGGNWSRVPELTLHLLAAGGGSPAAFFGQWLLRHKTIKPTFQRIFWTIVGAQGAMAAVFVYYRW